MWKWPTRLIKRELGNFWKGFPQYKNNMRASTALYKVVVVHQLLPHFYLSQSSRGSSCRSNWVTKELSRILSRSCEQINLINWKISTSKALKNLSSTHSVVTKSTAYWKTVRLNNFWSRGEIIFLQFTTLRSSYNHRRLLSRVSS